MALSVLPTGPSSGFVVGDPGLDVPGLEPVDEPRRPCRVTVTLLFVTYTGANVGSTWSYSVSAGDCGWWRTPHRRTVHVNIIDVVNELICDATFENRCEVTQMITIGVRAREHDWWLFDDIGDGIGVTLMPCEDAVSSAQISVLVAVNEYPVSWIAKLLRLRPRTAQLDFVFGITTQCA